MVTDQALMRGRPLADVVAAAVQGGVSCVQLREKQLGTREFLAQALILKALLAPQGIPLVINDRIDIALACGADGVHLGQNDLPADEARKLLPPGVFIGWSVESMEDVRQSAALPVDYLGVSPIFSTPTKTDTKDPWGLEGLAVVRAATALPSGGDRRHSCQQRARGAACRRRRRGRGERAVRRRRPLGRRYHPQLPVQPGKDCKNE
jgi:thiamine-phosphate pyrophosphorylase